MAMLVFLFAGLTTATNFATRNWKGTFADGSGVLRSLRPAVQPDFDFSPSDYFDLRNGIGNYHTGDLTFRWRVSNSSTWNDEDSAAHRDIVPLNEKKGTLLHTNFNNVFTNAASYMNITRDWLEKDGDIVLEAKFKNTGTQDIELGAFGFPIEFNNIFTGRTAEDTEAKGVLVDPYIGQDAGYLQVTRLAGNGPNLIITPSNPNTTLEAWRFLTEPWNDDLGYQQQTYEGNYAWQVLTKAYAENEWSSTEPWNVPRSAMIKAGQSITYSIRFSIVNQIWDIEDGVAAKGLPVAVGLPGYVLPVDIDGRLYLRSTSDPISITTYPANAIKFSPLSTSPNGTTAYAVQADQSAFGRVRVTIKYRNRQTHTVHYFVTSSALDTANKLGKFLFNQHYFTDTTDPFNRAPSVMVYDNEEKRIVLQDDLVYLAGLSDDGGAGAFETAAMKVYAHPAKEHVAKLEAMANKVLLGNLQYSSGDLKYAVRRSVFYWDPAVMPQYPYDPEVPYRDGWSWNQADSLEVWRTFNVPHVVAAWYSLYRADRIQPGILSEHNRTYYLDVAYNTIMVAVTDRGMGDEDPSRFAEFGMMGETLWPLIIIDLRIEGMLDEAKALEDAMRSRQANWATKSNPYGSEMAWDSTGEPGVYAWSRYFNDEQLINRTVITIRGYMPTVAHWGWNGNARRYWDFSTAGKLRRTERMLHHYGSGQNSLPLLDAYRYNTAPGGRTAFYDLRVAYGGNMGPLSNVDQNGFASMAFHSFPDTMKWEAYSGDYGSNYLAHIQGSATYLVQRPDYGWVSMGGNVEIEGNLITVRPKDAVRKQIYIAPLGLWIRFDGGEIQDFVFDAVGKTLEVQLGASAGLDASSTLMFYETTLPLGAKLRTSFPQQSGGYNVSIPCTVSFSL